MGGGNIPSMDFLKHWMYEELEMNVNGRIIVQDINVPEMTFQPDVVNEHIKCASNPSSQMMHDAVNFELNDDMMQSGMLDMAPEQLYFDGMMPEQYVNVDPAAMMMPQNAMYTQNGFVYPVVDNAGLPFQQY